MIKFRAFAWWILILFIALALVSGSAIAQSRDRDPLPDPAALPAGPETAESPPAPYTAQAVGDWSMLAYQKWQDGNWEIYVHDKAGPRRLTFDKNNDQQPSLDRGARRVAFTSDRSGDFDLYTIKVDGTNLRRILDNKSSIAFPAWSPDGNRLAIQAAVDGQFEIYVVNADGSSPQRLTYNKSYDGMPVWSPDGKQLAFASQRSGDYRIYVMNSDGSGLHRLSSYPFSLHPTWSPDGLAIAFDADVDGDGWQELAIIQANGTKERMVYNPPGANVTAWAGSWSPDKEALGFTEITAEKRGSGWVWVKGAVRKWNPTSGAVDLIPGGKEWYMEWQSKDAIPPKTTIEPLPDYSRAENFWLRWSGYDQGGSGLQSYAVYFNEHLGGGWQTYWGHTSSTAAPFPAQPGTTVEFLVRGTDNAFNEGPWAQQVTAQTTFFNTKTAGKISDNRGNPLAFVPLNVAPILPTGPVISNWQGDFAGYTFKDQDHVLSIKEPNYQSMPATIMAAGTDYLRDIYLMPRDTRISNGTFEKNSDTPLDWKVDGPLPVVVSSEAFATGHLSVRFGQSTVSQNKEIAQNAGTASLSQTVTIPPAMQQPTLSYMVWAAGAPPTAGSGFRVLIQADSQSLPVETNKLAAADWTLNWIDMSPWQGQQVTITFEIVQNAGDPAQTYYLDDVSLGSIYPELWIGLASGPSTALPGETVTVSLDYGNRGPLAAEDTVVELALPPELALISATPPYTFKNNVLRWDVGALPAHSPANRLTIELTPASRIQQTVTIKSLIFSGTKEAHLRNNMAEARIQITKRLYLPLLR